jgi:hypothetical protein
MGSAFVVCRAALSLHVRLDLNIVLDTVAQLKLVSRAAMIRSSF